MGKTERQAERQKREIEGEEERDNGRDRQRQREREKGERESGQKQSPKNSSFWDKTLKILIHQVLANEIEKKKKNKGHFTTTFN